MATICPKCQREFPEGARYCPFDGLQLVVYADAPPDPNLGREIIGYRIEERIGVGGCGAVYLARHPELSNKVAVKLLHVDLARSEHTVQRFLLEAKALGSLEHDNIVDVLHIGELGGGEMYLMMAYVEGDTLRDLLAREGALSMLRAVHIAQQVASAMAAAHDLGLIHRDLKPENIMITEAYGLHDVVKLLDFGLAKLIGQNLTGRGQVLGTFQYMPPEQIQGHPVDHRADIYSLGILLFEALTGRPPFVADSLKGYLEHHVSTVPPDVRSLVPIAPLGLARMIQKCMAKQPDDRYATMAEVDRALERVEPDLPDELPRLPARPQPPRIHPTAVVVQPTVDFRPGDEPD